MNEWYYGNESGQQGPVSLAQLAQWAQAGQFAPHIMVWRNGMAQWQAAGTVPELATLFGGAGMGQPAYAAPLGYAQATGAYGYPGQYPQMMYAGFWWRVLAYIIDAIILYVPNLLISNLVGLGARQAMIMSAPQRGGQLDIAALLSVMFAGMALSLALNWIYFAALESSKYQASLGKKVCGLVVTDLNGARIGFGRATGRYFGKILSAIIIYIGFMMAGWTQRKQALHDQLAGTLVWKKP
jgi:uncharacterized RDD family membrane protein YckC